MEQGLFQLLLLAGFVSLAPSVERKYYLIQQKTTWPDAQTYCRAKYVDLATVNGDDDMTKLQKEAEDHHFSSTAWIGLYNDINSWHWSYKNMPLKGWTNWDKEQPDNHYGLEECGVISPKGLWSDVRCTGMKPFVCYDAKYNDTARFIFISNNLSWPNAQSYCRQQHTDLAYALDDSDNKDIKEKISGSNPSWIGLFRSSWKWSDQTSPSKIRWIPGRPNNAKGNENCACTKNGLVDDVNCSEKFHFFCHSIIKGKEQITRLEVQSGKDVNDPAVKAALMEKVGGQPPQLFAHCIQFNPHSSGTPNMDKIYRDHPLFLSSQNSHYPGEAEGAGDSRQHNTEMERAARWNSVHEE